MCEKLAIARRVLPVTSGVGRDFRNERSATNDVNKFFSLFLEQDGKMYVWDMIDKLFRNPFTFEVCNSEQK